jgi:hypothetical protein
VTGPCGTLPVPIAAQRLYCLPVMTLSDGSVITIDAPGASRPMRMAVERSTAAEALTFVDVVASGTTEAAAQMSETATLPEFATTRTTETRWVGGRTEVELNGGSCIVVVVVVVDVDVVVEVVVEEVVAPGSVVEGVVVEVVVVLEVVVVGAAVVVVGSPLIRTTGGCKVTATITRSSWACRLGVAESCVTQFIAGESAHDGGSRIHLEVGSRPRRLYLGSERTKST